MIAASCLAGATIVWRPASPHELPLPAQLTGAPSALIGAVCEAVPAAAEGVPPSTGAPGATLRSAPPGWSRASRSLSVQLFGWWPSNTGPGTDLKHVTPTSFAAVTGRSGWTGWDRPG